MSIYALEYTDGRVTEITASNDTEAELAAMARFGEDAVAADQWDSNGTNDDDEPCERLLIWDCEADAENDPGANAVAQLTVIRSNR